MKARDKIRSTVDEPIADYAAREYLSAVEAARYLGVTVRELHRLVRKGMVHANRAPSGQMRFGRAALESAQPKIVGFANGGTPSVQPDWKKADIRGTRVIIGDSRNMREVPDHSVHLIITSPPYFNIKMYAREALAGDLGEIHDLDRWFEEIGKVWSECFRVLQPGRRLFINIMNLPVRERSGFRTLNLVGKTVDICEGVGFVFKRDIVWHKTNGVRAHFGTFPYPGGILINNMHEFILEFEKPAPPGFKKYDHLTMEQKETSKLDRDFWLSLKNTDVWLMKPVPSGDNRRHIAPFPLQLPARLIRAFSFVGETVLDPFVGAGTTLVACLHLQRRGIGYEINPEIAQLALQWIRDETHSVNGTLFSNASS
jgi:DNA modification methylase